MKTSFILAIIFLLLGSVFVFGQTTTTSGKTKSPVRCDLNLDKAPIIRGLRLGMDEKDADALLGKVEWKYEKDDDTSSAIAMPLRLVDGSFQPGFEGISFVYLKSFYAKIYEIRVMYDMKWKDITEFVDNFSPKLGVPRAAWVPNVLGAEMPCKDFRIVLMAAYGSSDLALTNELALKQIADEKQKRADAQKKAFKP